MNEEKAYEFLKEINSIAAKYGVAPWELRLGHLIDGLDSENRLYYPIDTEKSCANCHYHYYGDEYTEGGCKLHKKMIEDFYAEDETCDEFHSEEDYETDNTHYEILVLTSMPMDEQKEKADYIYGGLNSHSKFDVFKKLYDAKTEEEVQKFFNDLGAEFSFSCNDSITCFMHGYDGDRPSLTVVHRDLNKEIFSKLVDKFQIKEHFTNGWKDTWHPERNSITFAVWHVEND